MRISSAMLPKWIPDRASKAIGRLLFLFFSSMFRLGILRGEAELTIGDKVQGCKSDGIL